MTPLGPSDVLPLSSSIENKLMFLCAQRYTFKILVIFTGGADLTFSVTSSSRTKISSVALYAELDKLGHTQGLVMKYADSVPIPRSHEVFVELEHDEINALVFVRDTLLVSIAGTGKSQYLVFKTTDGKIDSSTLVSHLAKAGIYALVPCDVEAPIVPGSIIDLRQPGTMIVMSDKDVLLERRTQAHFQLYKQTPPDRLMKPQHVILYNYDKGISARRVLAAAGVPADKWLVDPLTFTRWKFVRHSPPAPGLDLLVVEPGIELWIITANRPGIERIPDFLIEPDQTCGALLDGSNVVYKELQDSAHLQSGGHYTILSNYDNLQALPTPAPEDNYSGGDTATFNVMRGSKKQRITVSISPVLLARDIQNEIAKLFPDERNYITDFRGKLVNADIMPWYGHDLIESMQSIHTIHFHVRHGHQVFLRLPNRFFRPELSLVVPETAGALLHLLEYFSRDHIVAEQVKASDAFSPTTYILAPKPSDAAASASFGAGRK